MAAESRSRGEVVKGRARRAFTLTEILLAFAFIGGLLVALMNLFSVSQRHAVSGEALLNSGVLAQMVLERFRSNIGMNPRYLRDLMGTNQEWSFTGTVVDPSATASAGKLQLSPFFQYLFAREASDLCAAGNQVPIVKPAGTTAMGIKAEEMRALFESFRDYQVSVQIADDVDLSSPTSPTAFKEAVKRITITVARSSVVTSKGADPLAYTISSRVATPADSLSPAALEAIVSRFEGPTINELYKEFFELAANNPYVSTTRLSPDSKKLLADAFMILAGANNEDLEVEGKYVEGSVLLDAAPDANYIDYHINRLSSPDVAGQSTSKIELSRLRSQKATIIFDTFKKIRHPMIHLNAEVIGPLDAPKETLLDRVRKSATSLQGSVSTMAVTTAEMDKVKAEFEAAQAEVTRLSSLPPAQCQALDPDTNATVTVPCACTSWDATRNATISTPCPSPMPTDPTLDAAIARRDATLDKLEALETDYAATQGKAVDTINEVTEMVTLCSYLQQFFTDPAYADVAKRPCKYSERFRKTMDELSQGLEGHLDQKDGVTPYERMRAAQTYAEVTACRELERDTADTAAQGRLKSLAGEFAPRTAELARFLASSDAHDLGQLKTRNTSFATLAALLHKETPRFCQVVALFLPGGEIANFIALHDQFVNGCKLDAKGILGDVKGILDGHHGGGHGGGHGGHGWH